METPAQGCPALNVSVGTKHLNSEKHRSLCLGHRCPSESLAQLQRATKERRALGEAGSAPRLSTAHSLLQCTARSRAAPAAGSPVRLKGAMESSGSFLMAEQFMPQTACSSLNQYVHLSNGNYTNERLAGVSTRINGLQQLSTCLQHAGGGYQHARGWIRVVHNALFPFNNLLGCCLVQKKKKNHPHCSIPGA